MKKIYLVSLLLCVSAIAYSIKESQVKSAINKQDPNVKDKIKLKREQSHKITENSKTTQKIATLSTKNFANKKANNIVNSQNLQENDLKILKSDNTGVEFLYSPGKIELTPTLYMPNTYTETTPGKPALPFRYVTIGVPVGSKIKIRLEDYSTEELIRVYIPPAQEIKPMEEYSQNMFIYLNDDKRDETIYSKDVFWPLKIVTIEEQKMYRNQEIVKLRINPLTYNPASKTLLVYKNLKIRIDFYGGSGIPREDEFFENVFKSTLINYEQARNWRKEENLRKANFYVGQWYKVETAEEGIYKIPASQINVSGIDPNTIKLYNGGSKMITEDYDTLKEIPIYVLTDTSILFYAATLSGWGKNDQLFYNPYTDTNVYWLTYNNGAGKRDSTPGTGSGTTPAYFFDTLHAEQDNDCPAQSGLKWIWEKIERPSSSSNLLKNYAFNVPSQYNDSFKLKIAIYGWYTDKASERELSANMLHNVRIHINGIQILEKKWIGGEDDSAKIFEATGTGLKDGVDTLTFELFKDVSTTKDIVFLDWFEIEYKKQYKAFNDELKFKGYGKFQISNFAQRPVIFDVTDGLNPIRIYDASFDTGVVNFYGNGVYYASSDFKYPVIKDESPYNIRELSQNLGFIIITHPDFLTCANTLKTHRETHGMQTGIFSTTDIYNNFSWGIKNSPYAIRNFLTFAYDNWGNSGYCLLLGAGTYGYKTSSLKNRVPPWEEGCKVGEYGYPPQDNHCWDNWFTDQNLAVGRIAAKDWSEAKDGVDKILEYESNMGVWRNRVLLISDDEDPDGNLFMNNIKKCAAMIPKEFDVFPLYSMNYPLESYRKPTARNDLVRFVGKGMNLSLYSGHGNLYLLAHEQLFTNPQDIEVLNNSGKYPVSQFWSCGVACFDRTDDNCMAEYLQKIGNKGSIATVAASRTTGGSSGMDTLLIRLMLKDKVNTVGQAMFGKNLSQPLQMNENLFADPATRFPACSIQTTIDSFPDTVRGGVMLEVKGKAPGAKFAYVTVRSSEYNYTYIYHWYPNSSGSATYKMRGRIVDNQLCEDILFEGITKVDNGEWKQDFFIPVLDSVADSVLCGKAGKISVFSWNDNYEYGNSAVDSVIIAPGGGNPADTIGPTVKLFVDSIRLADTGNVIPGTFKLTGVLQDESGINVFNKLKPLNLALTLRIMKDGLQPMSVLLADSFQYDTGSCQKGQFSYYPVTLENNSNDTICIQASDNLGNRTIAYFVVKVGVEEKKDSIKIFSFSQNYPNPSNKKTSFIYQIPKTTKVSLKLYNISGRCVNTLLNTEKKPGCYEIEIDAKDYPYGIYFAKFQAGNYKKIKKLILMK